MMWSFRWLKVSILGLLCACGTGSAGYETEPKVAAQPTHTMGVGGGLGLCMSLQMMTGKVEQSCKSADTFLTRYQKMRSADECGRGLDQAFSRARKVSAQCQAGTFVPPPPQPRMKKSADGKRKMRPGHAKADARHRALLAEAGDRSPYGERFPAPSFEACHASPSLMAINLPIGSTALTALDEGQRNAGSDCAWAEEYLACRALVDITQVQTSRWLFDRLAEAKAKFLSCQQ